MPKKNLNIQYSLIDGKASIYNFYDCEPSVYLPDSIDGYPVVGLVSGGFMSRNNGIKKIYLGENIEYISESFFQEWVNLKEVYFNKKIKKISQYCFNKCNNLQKIIFSDECELKHIDISAFEDCSKLKEVYLPKKVETLASRAFFNCTSLSHLELSNNITNLESFTISYTPNLKFLKIPPSVKNIDNSFAIYGSIEKLQLTSSEIRIRPLAFPNLSVNLNIDVGDVNAETFLEYHKDNRSFLRPGCVLTSSSFPITMFPDIYEILSDIL